MSVKIRLSKQGKRNAPSYKIVVTNTRSKRDGKNLAVLGYYNPSKTPEELKIDDTLFEEWVNKGAQVSDAVTKLRNGEYEFKPYIRSKKDKNQDTNTEQKNNAEEPTQESDDSQKEE